MTKQFRIIPWNSPIVLLWIGKQISIMSSYNRRSFIRQQSLMLQLNFSAHFWIQMLQELVKGERLVFQGVNKRLVGSLTGLVDMAMV